MILSSDFILINSARFHSGSASGIGLSPDTSLQDCSDTLRSWIVGTKVFLRFLQSFLACVHRFHIFAALEQFHCLFVKVFPHDVNSLNLPMAQNLSRLYSTYALDITCQRGPNERFRAAIIGELRGKGLSHFSPVRSNEQTPARIEFQFNPSVAAHTVSLRLQPYLMPQPPYSTIGL